MKTKYEICISDVILTDKNEINHSLIWRTMHAVTVSLSDLKNYIAAGHPFLCCKPKNRWEKQQLFGIDIDHFEAARGRYSFNEFIALLDALGLPPCLGYTTFSNPDRKRNRFRLLFQLSDPVTDIQSAWKISRFLFNIIDELIPGTADKNCRRPYGLFYPGKKIILCRPNQSARLDIISEAIQETEKPHVIIKTTWVWNKLQQILKKDPFIPSVQFGSAPAGYLINLGSEPGLYKYQMDIKTSWGISTLRLLDTNRICYNLLNLEKIIDKYYNIYGVAEQSNNFLQTRSMTVFEHYCSMLSSLLSKCARNYNCDKEQGKFLIKQYQKFVYQAMRIQILRNKPMTLPTRYVNYANAIQNIEAYPNLQKLFQRDPRKQLVIASIALLARDAAIKKNPSQTVPQYIVTYQMIIDKMKTKFKKIISKDALAEWIKQFEALHLIRICKDKEINGFIRESYPDPFKRPMILQVPYFDESVLIHAEILAAKYKPSVKKDLTNDPNYATTKNILDTLLSLHGWFSRDAFLRCIRLETALNNMDGYTVKNAATYFDRYIPQIQQELDLTKSSCTKELMARFPGNHKIGLTKLYYRKESI